MNIEEGNKELMLDFMMKTELNKSSNFIYVVVFVLWLMKKGRSFGVIFIF